VRGKKFFSPPTVFFSIFNSLLKWNVSAKQNQKIFHEDIFFKFHIFKKANKKSGGVSNNVKKVEHKQK